MVAKEQSPSGGCVLKLVFADNEGPKSTVAFGRLCVETASE